MPKHLTVDSYLDALAEPLRAVATDLRAVIDAALPAGQPRIWHGHPVWLSGGAPLAGFKAHRAHVTFMIWHGTPIVDDVPGRLQVGAHLATVKLRSAGDLDERAFASWLRTAHADAA